MTFAQGAFQIDPNATPEQIARKRAQIAAGTPRYGSAKYIGEGLGQLFYGIGAGRQERRLDAAENAGRASADSIMSGILGGSGGGGGGPLSILGMSPSGTWTPDAPAPKPHETNRGMPDVASGGLSFGLPQADAGVAQGGNDFGAAGMTPQEMLIAGAQKYGLNPIDVATAISYETGGKFDPLIKGPTTQWGSHEGLIQFGDPQGAKYGAEFGQGADAAWRSQLNPDSGAVWSYLNDTGVKPGMGLPEIYSAINAGGVGRMGASDANNGGAPGTVADKVAGMGDHRANAAQFLGGTWSPTEGNVTVSTQGQAAAPSQIPINELYMALQNPWLSPEQKALVTSMISEQQQASDPLRQLQLQKAQFEVDALQNPQPEPVDYNTFNGPDGTVYRFDPATGTAEPITGAKAPEPGWRVLTAQEAAANGLPEGNWQAGPNGEVKQIGGGGQNITVNNTPGTAPSDDALRKKLMEAEGVTWGNYLTAGNTSAGMTQDMELLGQVIEMAPQGPVTGRLAGMFPGVSDAAGVFQSVVKRIAPSLRVEGSGSQSDIEYNGFLQSLPALSNRPEANRAIATFLKAKAGINMERGQVIQEYQSGAIDATEARKRITQIDSRSILTPELKGLLGAMDGGAAPGTGTPVPSAFTASPDVMALTADGSLTAQEIWDNLSDTAKKKWVAP